MKHHFANLLESASQYWTLTQNDQRWQRHFEDLAEAPANTTALTICRDDKNWERVTELISLKELTLHEPNQQQLNALPKLPQLTALRISHARPHSLEMLVGLAKLQELVLEYVSGFSDLTPVGNLPSLTALHMENLRGVTDFSGLDSSTSLKYLAIYGTLDWDQPIESFDFLGDIKTLEFLKLGFGVRVPKTQPVFQSLLNHQSLKEVSIGLGTLTLEDFAWLEAKLPHVIGAMRPAYVRYGGEAKHILAPDIRATMPEDQFLRLSGVSIAADGRRIEHKPCQAMLLGKGMRTLSGSEAKVAEKCIVHERKYRALIKNFQAS